MPNNELKRYTLFYTYTNTSAEIKEVASQLAAKLGDSTDTMQAVWEVCELITSRARDRSVTPSVAKRVAKSLLESRFTKASEMIEVPISSCGAVATLSASILREMGYTVRLVHGDKPKADQHAWNEIWLENESKWQPFDCTAGNVADYELSDDSIRILDCVDWSEITDLLKNEHEENMREKKLLNEEVARINIHNNKSFDSVADRILSQRAVIEEYTGATTLPEIIKSLAAICKITDPKQVMTFFTANPDEIIRLKLSTKTSKALMLVIYKNPKDIITDSEYFVSNVFEISSAFLIHKLDSGVWRYTQGAE